MNDCQHYWIIETPNGPSVGAECRLCGATREFKTVGKDSGWTKVQQEKRRKSLWAKQREALA